MFDFLNCAFTVNLVTELTLSYSNDYGNRFGF